MRARWIILGIIVAIAIMAAVVYLVVMRREEGEITIQSLDFVAQQYLPVLAKGSALKPPPTPIAAKRSLNQCCGGVTCDMLATLGADWYYNWSIGCGDCGGIPRYPMVRDKSQLGQLRNNPTLLNSCDRPVLGFNEPNNQDCAAGACVTLTELVSMWHELEELLPNHELVSPAMLMGWATNAYDLMDFVDAYRSTYGVYPRFEYAALHEYGSQSLSNWKNSFGITKTDYLAVKAALAARGYDVPIWITEMGYWHNEASSMTAQYDAGFYLQAWLNFCNSDDKCEYLNWFAPTQGDYWFVVPLTLNGSNTNPGTVWQDWGN